MPSEPEMQEKLKNMSPEELKEFQIQNCIFCQIAKGKVSSKKVYEDDKCIAVLDINPANPGHILLLPKEHYSIMPLIPEDIIKHLFMVSKQLSASLLKSLQAEGTNIFVANGAAAGQKAQHFMIHVIPRMEKDGVNLSIEAKEADESSLEKIRKPLVTKIMKDFGITIEEPKETEEEEITVKPEEVEAKLKEGPKEVEAEFKEEANETEKEKKKSKKEPKKSKKDEEAVTLDDISNLITGRK